jgi:mRNA-degrading endonuclease RelE of RelBE toxin-antitoxin system
MSYRVLVSVDVKEFPGHLDDKSRRIIGNGLKGLGQNPFPGKGLGDKERLPVNGRMRYRLHIGRTWTVFYSILEEAKQVRVAEVLPIDDAHKRYGY